MQHGRCGHVIPDVAGTHGEAEQVVLSPSATRSLKAGLLWVLVNVGPLVPQSKDGYDTCVRKVRHGSVSANDFASAGV